MTILHSLQDKIHGIVHIDYRVADETARLALSFDPEDVTKVIWQMDDDSLWFVTDDSPATMVEIGGGGAFVDLTDTPANFTSAENKLVRVNSTPDAVEFVDEALVLDTGEMQLTLEDAVTADLTDIASFRHNSSGTPADGFGTGIRFYGESDTTENRLMGRVGFAWRDVTDGFRHGAFVVYTDDDGDLVETIYIAGRLDSVLVGNIRGSAAVDLQSMRSLATQVAAGDESAILAGRRNTVSAAADWSVILAGYNNEITDTYGVILSGYDNLVSGKYGIAAGYKCVASGDYSIATGSQNTASLGHALAIGGKDNTASGTYSIILGGNDNNASSTGVVLGGYSNTASGSYSLAWGNSNTANAVGAIAGGYSCTASGRYSFAFGRDNVASAWYGMAFGKSAEAAHRGMLALSGGLMGTRGYAQMQSITGRRHVTHSDAAWYSLHLDGSDAAAGTDDLGIPNDTRCSGLVMIDGLTAGATKSFTYWIKFIAENDGGTLTIKDQTLDYSEDADDPSFNAQLAVAGTDLAVQVQDSDGSSDVVRWHFRATMNLMRYP